MGFDSSQDCLHLKTSLILSESSSPGMAPHSRADDDMMSELMECKCGDEVWMAIRREAEEMTKEHTCGLDNVAASLLPGIVESSIMRWDSLEEALAAHLANKLSFDDAPMERWHSLLRTAFNNGTSSKGELISNLITKDLLAIKERDPACPSLAHALLHFKGFQGLEVYRTANWLWRKGQRSVASLLQSRVSEVFGMDIHPAAEIGWGIMIDHATGIVIGETAIVGNGCTLLHGVTLGGTGKESGDRHPKLGSKVLVGAGVSILGNVKIGDCAKIGASAVVLNDIPSFATAVGCSAKVIGRAKEENPASGVDHACSFVQMFSKRSKCMCPFRRLEPLCQGFMGPYGFAKKSKNVCGTSISFNDAAGIFFELDSDHDGQMSEGEFQENVGLLKQKFSKVSKLA